MSKIGTDAKVYPLLKIALVVDALREAGVSPIEALRGSDVSNEELYSVETRVSLNQVIEVYRNAARLAPNQDFGFSTGLEAHVSTYGAYGFAILSSTDFRQTMRIIVQYHLLATPLVELRFREEKGSGIWIIKPLPHPAVDAYLYRFLVEHQFGVHVSLQRDIMGASFAPSELHVTFAKPRGLQKYAETMGCKVLFDQPENRLIFDGHWLRGTARVGNVITNKIVVSLCDSLLKELELHSGLAGQIRHILFANPGDDTSLVSVGRRLKISERTLRRRLLQEGTSFREIAGQLKIQLAIKYLRDTDLSVEDIAFALGFSDCANFRQAFRRWTNKSPAEFRRHSGAAIYE